MNKAILVGRLVKDPEVKTTSNQVSVCSFTIAVDRRFKNANGERQADFINCVAWRSQADFLGRYFQKGSRVGLVGSIQSRSYEDANGKRVYVTEVVVDEIEFVESKRDSGSNANYNAPVQSSQPASQNAVKETSESSDFFPAMDDDTSLPFDL